MRDDGVFKDVPRARRGVIGALLLVFVVIAAAALLVPVASDGRPNRDASTSAGVSPTGRAGFSWLSSRIRLSCASRSASCCRTSASSVRLICITLCRVL